MAVSEITAGPSLEFERELYQSLDLLPRRREGAVGFFNLPLEGSGSDVLRKGRQLTALAPPV